MRIKALLLGAALVAAGVASSMAQSNVYSQNIVGYVNVQIQPGYNLVVNQLDVDGIDNVNTALTNGISIGLQLFGWNGTGFTDPITFYGAEQGGWFDGNFNEATNNVFPGNAFFLYNPNAACTLTLVGNVLQATNNYAVGAGYAFCGVNVPIAQDIDTNGFPATTGMQYFTFSGGTYQGGYTYYDANNGGPGWFDNNFNIITPTPALGQGFMIYNPNSAGTWTQTFTAQ